jgi:hypothetical protein
MHFRTRPFEAFDSGSVSGLPKNMYVGERTLLLTARKVGAAQLSRPCAGGLTAVHNRRARPIRTRRKRRQCGLHGNSSWRPCSWQLCFFHHRISRIQLSHKARDAEVASWSPCFCLAAMVAFRQKRSNSPPLEKEPVAEYVDEERNSDVGRQEETLHRNLKARQISMIAVRVYRVDLRVECKVFMDL